MQRGGKMDFKGLAKQLAPTVAPIAGKAINAALSKTFSYGRKRIRKKHSQKLDLVKQPFNKANLGCRVFSLLQKKVSGGSRKRRQRTQWGQGAGMAMVASANLPSLLDKLFDRLFSFCDYSF